MSTNQSRIAGKRTLLHRHNQRPTHCNHSLSAGPLHRWKLQQNPLARKMKYCGSLPLVFVVTLVSCRQRTSAFCTPKFMSTSTTKRPTASSFLLSTNLHEQEDGTVDARTMAALEINRELDIQPNQDEEGEPSTGIGIWTARALLMLIAILWGTNFGAVKYLETLCFHPPCVHPPSEAAFARFGLAALVSVPLLIGQRKDIILAGLECGLWITLGYITQALALSTITAGKCAFICSLTVVVVPLISAAFYGKPLKSMHLIAGAVALAGVGILEGLVDFNDLLRIPPALADPETSLTTAAIVTHPITAVGTGILGQIASALGVTQGDIIALGQPIGFGYTFIRIEHYVEKFKDVPNKVLTLSAAQCVAVGTMSLLWVLYDYGGTLPTFEYMLEPHRMAAIAWTGIVTTVFAIYLEGVALQTATATDAALTFSSEPVWASLFGLWLLNERLGVNSYVGGAVILIACVLGGMSDLSAEGDTTRGN